ncbi:hypothetical protein PC128_g18178 [Phytophthora cactorum]|nr:hypothetical protein PC128_g18178 [Phytophthora cactorum]
MGCQCQALGTGRLLVCTAGTASHNNGRVTARSECDGDGGAADRLECNNDPGEDFGGCRMSPPDWRQCVVPVVACKPRLASVRVCPYR